MNKITKNILYLVLITNLIPKNVFCWGDYKNLPKDYPYSRECFLIFKEIQEDCLLKTPDEKLIAWSKFKKKCSKDGVYDKYKALIYSSYGNVNKAIDIMQTSLKNANYNIIENASFLAKLLYDQGNLEASKELAEMLIEKYPNYFNGYAHLGEYYMYYHEWELAKKYFEKAYELNSKVPALMSNLAAIYYRYGRNKDTIEFYNKAYTSSPCYTIQQRIPTAAMIAALIHLDRLSEAKKLLKEQLENDPEAKDNYGHKAVKLELEKTLAAKNKK